MLYPTSIALDPIPAKSRLIPFLLSSSGIPIGMPWPWGMMPHHTQMVSTRTGREGGTGCRSTVCGKQRCCRLVVLLSLLHTTKVDRPEIHGRGGGGGECCAHTHTGGVMGPQTLSSWNAKTWLKETTSKD